MVRFNCLKGLFKGLFTSYEDNNKFIVAKNAEGEGKSFCLLEQYTCYCYLH